MLTNITIFEIFRLRCSENPYFIVKKCLKLQKNSEYALGAEGEVTILKIARLEMNKIHLNRWKQKLLIVVFHLHMTAAEKTVFHTRSNILLHITLKNTDIMKIIRLLRKLWDACQNINANRQRYSLYKMYS